MAVDAKEEVDGRLLYEGRKKGGEVFFKNLIVRDLLQLGFRVTKLAF